MRIPQRSIEKQFEDEAVPHLDELYRSAVRLLRGDREGAKDLVQEVYTTAWKSFHKYCPGTNCRAWLYSILMNQVRHCRRSQMNRTEIPASRQDEELLDKTPAPPAIPETLTDEDVLSSLDKLPEDYRDVILLADAQGFSYKEIAEFLEIPVGTVMSRLSRGREALRRELREIARDYGIKTLDNNGEE